MTAIRIRPPEKDETALSPAERMVAVREGFQRVEEPHWHPAIVRNFSLMSARINRRLAVQEVLSA